MTGRLPPVPERIGMALPPLRQRAFWIVQALVLVIAVLHTAFETVLRADLPAPLYLVPDSLFFVPVVYAALRFGFRGAVSTAAWSFAVTIPNLLLLHDGLERAGGMWQGTILMGIGVLVGLAVDREHAAREDAEARERAREVSERRYRALYDRAAEAVLVADDDGRIEEANAAAGALLGQEPAHLAGRTVDDVVGAELAADLRAGGRRAQPRQIASRDGRTAWVQAMEPARAAGAAPVRGTQVILRDVTDQVERQLGMEAWARHDIEAREQERRRIGRELHDGPLQSLVLLARRLDSLPAGDRRGPALAEAEAIIDGVADELRRVSRSLRPPILDDLGLVAALRAETAEFGRRSGIAAVFSVHGAARPLAEDVELLLLRIAQEGLHNAERHSGAASADVALTFEAGRVRLEVADDGRGIGDVPTARTLLESGKLGVVGMQERVRLAHGSISIAGRPGGGTSVVVEVPVPPAP